MRSASGFFLALATIFALSGCAARARTPRGPIVSPTGIVYPPGRPPARTRFSQTATLLLTQDRLDRALEMALEGLAADSANPLHSFLAGSAYIRLGHHAEANRMFNLAERIYPAYQLQVEPERMAAWAQAYDEGVEAYGGGNTERAIEAWEKAATIYDLRPEAHRNLATLWARDGRYDAAITAYQEALAGLAKEPATYVLDAAERRARAELTATTEQGLSQLFVFVERFAEAEPLLRRQLAYDSTNVQLWADLATALKAQGKAAEAAAIYEALLSGRAMETTQLFNLGVGLFRAADYARAGEAFARLTRLRPLSRDAWFNYANSLFAAKAWAPLVAAGDRLIELDPLGKNVGLIAARAHLEAGDQEGALRGLQRVDGAPVYLEALQMRPFDAVSRVEGQVTGNQADAGSTLRLRFTFYDDAIELGSEIVDLTAPAKGETTALDVRFGARASGFRYEILP